VIFGNKLSRTFAAGTGEVLRAEIGFYFAPVRNCSPCLPYELV